MTNRNPNDKTAYDYDCKLGDKRLADRIADLEATVKHMAKQGTPVGYLNTIEMLTRRISDLEANIVGIDARLGNTVGNTLEDIAALYGRIGRNELRLQNIEAITDRSVDRIDVLYANAKRHANTNADRFAAIEANIEGFADRIGELEEVNENIDEAAASLVDNHGSHPCQDDRGDDSEYDDHAKAVSAGARARYEAENDPVIQNTNLKAEIIQLKAELANRDERHAGIRKYRDLQDVRINQLEGTLSMLHCQIDELKAQRDAG